MDDKPIKNAASKVDVAQAKQAVGVAASSVDLDKVKAALGELGGSGELEDLQWFPVAETARLKLVDVTQVVLAEGLRRWRRRVPAAEPAPLLSYRGQEVRVRRPGHPPLIGEVAVLAAASLD